MFVGINAFYSLALYKKEKPANNRRLLFLLILGRFPSNVAFL